MMMTHFNRYYSSGSPRGLVRHRSTPTAQALGEPGPARASVATSAVLALSVALAGCETATAVKDKVVEVASDAGSYVSTQASHAADFVMGRKSGSLANDGTTCFTSARVPFYAAVDEVTEAQRIEYGAAAGAAVATFAAFYADSVVAKIAAIGFGATMVAVIANIEADNERIANVSSTFNGLVNCRRQEARGINKEYRNRAMTHSTAEERLARLRTLMAEDVEAAQGVNAILTARTDGYELTTQQAQEKAPAAKSTKETKERKQQTKEANAAIQSNQKGLAQQTASIEQAEALSGPEGFNLSWLRAPWIVLAGLGQP